MRVHLKHRDVPFTTEHQIKDNSKLELRKQNLTTEVGRLNSVLYRLQLDYEENELLVGDILLDLEWGERIFDRKLAGSAEKTAATDKLAEDLVRLTAYIAALEEKRKALRSEINANRLYVKGQELKIAKDRSAYVASKEHKELIREAAKPSKRRHQLAKKIREHEARRDKLQDRLSAVEATLERVKSE